MTIISNPHDSRRRRPAVRLLSRWTRLAFAVALLSGCSGSNGDSFYDYDPDANCVDLDGDGYGAACSAGMDCDDSDVSVTDDCYRCLDNDPGCPCAVEGEREACGIVSNRHQGEVVCGYGERVCTGGVWEECIVNNATTLTVPEQPGVGSQNLGSASPCANNPCSLDCQEFIDTAGGIPDSGGIQTTNAGLGLVPQNGSSAPLFCLGGATGTCSHSVCSAGSALLPGCDIVAPPQGATLTLFSETFANNLAGWSLGSEWAVGPTAVSSGQNFGNPDPAFDHTPTGDNGVAGIVIGGIASTSAHGYNWLTSPPVDLTAATGTVTLSYTRWFNFEGGQTSTARVEVWDGASWVTIQSMTTGITENAWSAVTLDVTSYKNAAFQVRFGYNVLKKGGKKVSGLNVDDVMLTTTGAAPLPSSSCVQAICAVDTACCTTSWSAACVAKVPTVCGLDCANVAGICALCYHDAQDHDGDGYSFSNGDCLDCDPNVNPGAFDFPGNGEDENCSGVADDEGSPCDANLPMASSQSSDYAKAMGLCKATYEGALGKQRTWGVLSSALVQADGLQPSSQLSRGILAKFGPQNYPFEGAAMAVLSSGTARAVGDAGYVNPNGQSGSYNQGLSCSFPAGFPKNAAGCPGAPAGSPAYDSSGLWLKIRVPTNALSMSYKFNFFSSEYPEWVCSAYNDSFVALLSSSYQPANPAANSGNISFDSNNNPVSVNISFFTVVGGSKLDGTGFDGLCQGQTCGGATDWLQSSAPVVPGETITLQFTTWDTGDHKWDSTVLLDDFQWSIAPATIKTFVPQPPAGTTYSSASFTRDYDVSHSCPAGSTPSWGLWSWNASTPLDSRIEFYVQTAATQAELDTAPLDPLRFSNPPGPAALTGKPAVASAGVPDTQGGAASVGEALSAAGRALAHPYLRVTSTLIPSSDGKQTPTLATWNQQFSCVPSE